METLINKTGENLMTIFEILVARDANLDSDLNDEIDAVAAETGLSADDDRHDIIDIIAEG